MMFEREVTRMGRTALIGHTGFVGGTLARQSNFTSYFNRSTIGSIKEHTFDTVVCAAAPGSMFEANRSPEIDEVKVNALIDQLSHVRTERFVLISSIAVLADFAGGDDETSTAFQQELAYGRHRRGLEEFVEENFDGSTVVRLPALFGRGLRKNFIFDLLNPTPSILPADKLETLLASLDPRFRGWLRSLYAFDPTTEMFRVDRIALDSDPRRRSLDAAVVGLGFSAVQFHHAETTYQFYDMRRLSSDLKVAVDAGVSRIHLVTEPLNVSRIHERLTGERMPDTDASLHHEDMRTLHADLWGVRGPYLEDSESTLGKLADFFAGETQTE